MAALWARRRRRRRPELSARLKLQHKKMHQTGPEQVQTQYLQHHLVSQRFADHHIQVGQGQLANSSVQLMMRYKVTANMISFSSFLTFQGHIWCASDQLAEKAKPKPKLALSSNFANI